MKKTPVTRYSNIAISLHWLMAFLIVGMLIVGKLMHNIDDSSPLRFALVQWHKTFGVLILFLAVFRLLWRLTHRAPGHPADAPAWEHFAANVSHIALYALLFIAPITGWMLVSVSPLNVDTYLFNVIPWPHLPWLQNIVDKESAEAQFYQFHEIATGLLIVLLLLHIGAALKHHIIDKDTVLTRMLPSRAAGTGKALFGLVAVLVLGITGAVFGYAQLNAAGSSLSAGNSAVRAIAMVSGEATTINFTESTVTATINTNTPESSSLQANVTTASATSKNLQVSGPLPDVEWFDSDTHPQANFVSNDITAISKGLYSVTGVLTIKGIDQNHSFELKIDDQDGVKMASGEFVVDRTEYQLGMESQPNDDYVGNDVTIAFEFTLSE